MKKTSPANSHYFENERALKELTLMKHKDLQRACIVRGLESKNVVDFDHHKLVSWFIKNYDNTQSEELLNEHDAWVETELLTRGYKKGDVLLSPALRFGYVGNIEEMEKPKIIKEAKQKVDKPKSEKKEKSVMDPKMGIRTGTKKALTYELTMEGLEIGDIIKKVKEKFPEADEKSIKIWNKRASKL